MYARCIRMDLQIYKMCFQAVRRCITRPMCTHPNTNRLGQVSHPWLLLRPLHAHLHRTFWFRTATSSTPQGTNTAVVAHPVVTDLTVCIFSRTISPSTCELDPRIWHRIEKELYLYTSKQTAWLHVALANKEKLAAGDLLVLVRC